MNKQEFNPLQGWSKEEIKSALKANTKTTLLKSAMQWRLIAESYKKQLDSLQEDFASIDGIDIEENKNETTKDNTTDNG
tara:strand:+ start:329 stop:565 length:237 start_codon:yes stop_codon:yes gene_type:complete